MFILGCQASKKPLIGLARSRKHYAYINDIVACIDGKFRKKG